MEISKKEIEHLASLSALNFSEQEKDKFANDLSQIFDMINQIQKANQTSDRVYNKSHKLTELREDEVKESYPVEEILMNAPKQRRNCFNVPLVVE